MQFKESLFGEVGEGLEYHSLKQTNRTIVLERAKRSDNPFCFSDAGTERLELFLVVWRKKIEVDSKSI